MDAFVFPGQGSQKVGMGRALVERYEVARQTFDEADSALGFSLSRLCIEGPDAELQLTAHAQPAILTASIAAWRVLQQETDLQPAAVAGHSLGEYSALVCAGAIRFQDAVHLVHQRGRYMQEAVPAGAGSMAAIIGLSEAQVVELCTEAAGGDVLEPANFNGAGQIVIAGHAAAVARALPLAKKLGARALPLKVSAPFHCSLMEPAARRLAEQLELAEVGDPAVVVVANVDAEPNRDARRVKDLLRQQVTAPVRWEASVQRLVSLGITRVVEVGPGRVLTGLVKRIAPSLSTENVDAPEHIEALREQPRRAEEQS